MTNLLNHYKELLSLTKEYIHQNHVIDEWKFAERETFIYFKSNFKKNEKPANSNQQHPLTATIPDQKKPLPLTTLNSPIPAASYENTPKPALKIAETKSNLPKPIIPSPVKESKEFQQLEKKSFQLQPLTETPHIELSEIRQMIKDHFPTLLILDNPLVDVEVKKTNNLNNKTSNPVVIVLSFGEEGEHKTFIENFANAIHAKIAPTRVISAHIIEKQNAWERMLSSKDLRLVIAPDYVIYALPEFMKFYKEAANGGKRFLGHIELCLLSDISLYLKEPKLKAVLWKTVSDLLK